MRSDVLRLPALLRPKLFSPTRALAAASEQPLVRERLVIVGNGMVGQRFCETLVKLGGHQRYQVVVLGEERTPAYDRVHLTDIWQGRDPQELLLREQDWYGQHDVELRLGQRVQSIDTEARQVVTGEGEVVPYDRLVFATGSRVPSLDIKLDEGVKLLSYRTLEDAQRILAEVTRGTARQVVVIGAGLLGLEAARALQRLGCPVTVLEASSQLLPRQLDVVAAQALEQQLVEAGLDIRTRCRIERVRKYSQHVSVVLEGGEEVDAQVVVAAVGARACDDVGRAAGLTCDMRGGIRVDDKLRASQPDIYAIGECAHHPRVPHGLVAPGYEMADVLARLLMGQRDRLRTQQAITRLKLDLTEVTVLGNPLAPDAGRDLVWKTADCYRRIVVNNRRIVAAVCIGQWNDLPTLQRLVTQGRRVTQRTLRVFEESGDLAPEQRALDVHQWPDTAVVCNCANVTCGSLRRAIGRGSADVKALGRVTSAGTLCGSCQPQLAALCGAPAMAAPAQPGAQRGLWVVSGVALLAVFFTLLVPRIPVADSVRLQGIDVLWVDSWFKQVSGFTLLGLMVLGLSLSLRKRVKRFNFGAFPYWRLVHAALGLTALAAAFGHTGFRLGYNLNLVLMLVFLTSAATGAVSGVVLSKAKQTSELSMLQRAGRALRVMHDWVLWPLLVLIGFHVLKVYYF